MMMVAWLHVFIKFWEWHTKKHEFYTLWVIFILKFKNKLLNSLSINIVKNNAWAPPWTNYLLKVISSSNHLCASESNGNQQTGPAVMIPGSGVCQL